MWQFGFPVNYSKKKKKNEREKSIGYKLNYGRLDEIRFRTVYWIHGNMNYLINRNLPIFHSIFHFSLYIIFIIIYIKLYKVKFITII